MEYRWLNGWEATDEEWNRIDKILAAQHWMSLSREWTRIRLAEDNGKIVGLYVLQAIPHAEPMWVDKRYYGTGLADALADDMMEFLTAENARGWMIVAENPIAQKMCEARNMTRVSCPVFVMGGG